MKEIFSDLWYAITHAFHAGLEAFNNRRLSRSNPVASVSKRIHKQETTKKSGYMPQRLNSYQED